jgi:hypothetical protein
MGIKELEAELEKVKKQLYILQAIEEIQKLQRSYGVYLERGQSKEIIDCFSDGPGVYLDFGVKRYLGKEGVKRYFSHPSQDGERGEHPEYFHEVMQLTPIINVDPDGKKAYGFWNGWGVMIVPRGDLMTQSIFSCIYQNDYVKENGIWKIQVLRLSTKYCNQPKDWIVAPDRLDTSFTPDQTLEEEPDEVVPTFPGYKREYPTAYVMPYRFNHPVTGKPTSERSRNVKLFGSAAEELYKDY